VSRKLKVLDLFAGIGGFALGLAIKKVVSEDII